MKIASRMNGLHPGGGYPSWWEEIAICIHHYYFIYTHCVCLFIC